MFLNPIVFSFSNNSKTKSLTFDYLVKNGDFFSVISIAQTGYYGLPTADNKAFLTIEELSLFVKLLNL
ncbi:MAG: hypothetical protein ACPLXO_02960, partial [Desulfurella sp.]